MYNIPEFIRNRSLSVLLIIFLLCSFVGSELVSSTDNFSINFNMGSSILESSKPPNVIIIDLDRLSKNRMECYGYDQSTSPNMCDFGKKNLIFENAISQSGWTGSSVSSLFTSQYVGAHGVYKFNDNLSNESLTMAEILRANGYTTVAYPSIPNRHPKFLIPRYNVDQGFETYVQGHSGIQDHMIKSGKFLTDEENEPFFMYIQSYEPHRYLDWLKINRRIGNDHNGSLGDLPKEVRKEYTPTDIVLKDGQYQLKLDNRTNINLTKEDIRKINSTYDEAVRRTDKTVGWFLDSLKKHEVYSESIIIITANHGELLDTQSYNKYQRFGHGDVYDEMVNVPFIMHLPDENRGERKVNRRIQDQIEFVDVLPTIIDLTDSSYKDADKSVIQGESFTPLIRGEGYEEGHAFITSYGGESHAVRNNSWKYVKLPEGEQLFNLNKDPYERDNIINENPRIADNMRQQLEKNRMMNDVITSSR